MVRAWRPATPSVLFVPGSAGGSFASELRLRHLPVVDAGLLSASPGAAVETRPAPVFGTRPYR
jgi:hypothetical protein